MDLLEIYLYNCYKLKNMKKIHILILAILLAGFSQNVSAQVKDHAVKFNAFGAIIGQYQLAYEHPLNDKSSVQLSVGYFSSTSSQTLGTDKYESKTGGFLIIPEYRYYFNESMKGLYGAAFFRLRTSSNTLTDQSIPIGTDVSRKETGLTIGGGAVLGYQFLVADALVIDLFVGPQYKSRSSSITYDKAGVTDTDFQSKFLDFKIDDASGAGLRFGLNLGYAF